MTSSCSCCLNLEQVMRQWSLCESKLQQFWPKFVSVGRKAHNSCNQCIISSMNRMNGRERFDASYFGHNRLLLQTWLDLPLELSWNSLPSLNRINSRKMLDVYRGHEMENWREKFLSSKSNMCADDDAYRFFSIPYATCRFGNLLQMWLDG